MSEKRKTPQEKAKLVNKMVKRGKGDQVLKELFFGKKTELEKFLNKHGELLDEASINCLTPQEIVEPEVEANEEISNALVDLQSYNLSDPKQRTEFMKSEVAARALLSFVVNEIHRVEDKNFFRIPIECVNAKNPIVRNIRVEKGLYDQLKKFTEKKGYTIIAGLNHALKEYLDKYDK